MVLGEAVLRLLGHLGARQGLLLVLEDLHWADPDTLAVLEYLLDNVASQPVLIVVTSREQGSAVPVLHHAARRDAVRLLELEGLDEAGVVEMATACLGDDPRPELLDLVRSRAEGVPLLVEELLDVARRHPSDLVVPVSIAESTRAQLAALAEEARRGVTAAAVLGEQFDWALLPPMTGLDAATVLDALRGAVRDGLLVTGADGRFAFRHALTRDAVLADILPPERAALAGRALEALERAGSDLDRDRCAVAAAMAEVAGNRRRAAELLVDAGRRDLESGALATAEATVERARALGGDDVLTRVQADEVLAEVLVQAGRPEDAAAATSSLLAGLQRLDAAPSRVSDAHLRLARAWTVAGAWSAAEEQTRLAREVTADLPRADLVEALVALGRNRFAEAERLARRVLDARVPVRPEVTCEALEVLGRLARRRDGAAAEALFTRALDTAERHRLPVWRARALHELSTIDLFGSLRTERAQQARGAALDTGSIAVATAADYHRASMLAWRGEHDEALAILEAVEESARWLRLPILPMVLIVQGEIRAQLGEEAAAEALAADALARAPEDDHVAAAALHVRATSRLLVEDRDGALQALDRAAAHLRREVDTTSSPPLARWALLAALERGADALQLARTQTGAGVARWTVGHLGLAEAVVLARRGDRAAAAEAFAAADRALLAPVPMPHFRHLARRLVAEAAISDGWGEPTRWLLDDLTHFERMGHDRVAAACRALLRRAGAPVPRRTPGPDVPDALRSRGVTSREVEVLALVGQGLSNREIAARLVLSPRTVEKHLERLMAKTGTHSRSALVARAARSAW
ncbi:ATP-binding protein [Geodermatophilus sp. SYSU D01105]